MCEFQRTKNEYNSKVLIDGWYDNRVLEEEVVKDFLAKRDNGQLMIQKMGSLLKKMMQPGDISTSSDGFVKFGDWLQILNPGADPNMIRLQKGEPRRPTVLSIDAADEMLYFRNELPDPSSCTASFKLNPVARNLFQLLSPDKGKLGQKVTFGEPIIFQISELLGPPMYLSSDNSEYVNKTKHGKNQEIRCMSRLCFLCHFFVEHIDPRKRFQTEGCPIQVNTQCIIKHAKSHQCLCVEQSFFEKTFFGYEHELSARTRLNENRAEMDCNKWIFRAKQLVGGNVDLYTDTRCNEEEEPNHV